MQTGRMEQMGRIKHMGRMEQLGRLDLESRRMPVDKEIVDRGANSRENGMM